jgi:uncharacterized damage-inducible protein DinB
MSDPTRRAELFGGADSARRFTGPTTGDERRMLIDVLNAQRATLRLKCSGLGPELALRSVEPSTLSLLGLVRHLADVERRWFRRVLAGQDAPALFSSTADPDEDFDGATDDPGIVASAWEAWRAEVTFAEQFVTEAPDLDVEGDDSWRGTVSLRWVLIHMIEEYARHNGHADRSANASTERSACEAGIRFGLAVNAERHCVQPFGDGRRTTRHHGDQCSAPDRPCAKPPSTGNSTLVVNVASAARNSAAAATSSAVPMRLSGVVSPPCFSNSARSSSVMPGTPMVGVLM